SLLRRRAGCRVSSWIKRKRSSRPARRSFLRTGRWIRRRRVTLISRLSLRRKINLLDQSNNRRATTIGVATPVLGPVLRPNRRPQGTKKMSLEMKRSCEKCGRTLVSSGVAYICSYECTYCERCAEELNCICPNCGGELVTRPRRKESTSSATADA